MPGTQPAPLVASLVCSANEPRGATHFPAIAPLLFPQRSLLSSRLQGTLRPGPCHACGMSEERGAHTAHSQDFLPTCPKIAEERQAHRAKSSKQSEVLQHQQTGATGKVDESVGLNLALLAVSKGRSEPPTLVITPSSWDLCLDHMPLPTTCRSSSFHSKACHAEACG